MQTLYQIIEKYMNETYNECLSISVTVNKISVSMSK